MSSKEYVSTGYLPVDLILTGFGQKLGKIYELYGESSLGKSLIPLQFGVNFLQEFPKSKILYIDTELAFDLRRIKDIGGDEDDIILVLDEIKKDKKDKLQPVLFSEIISYLQSKLAKEPNSYFIIWDSIPATVEDTAGQVGSLSRLLSQSIKLLRHYLENTGSIMWAVNHIYSNIGSRGNSTKGGRALKYYPDVKIKIIKEKEIVSKTVDNVYYTEKMIVRLITAKNRLNPSNMTALLVYDTHTGISKEETLIEMLKELGLVSQNKAWYRFNYENIDFKFNNAKSFLAQAVKYPKLLDLVNYLIIKSYSEVPALTEKLSPVLKVYEERLYDKVGG